MVFLTDIAICSLNQWALDFTGNRDRILQSIKLAKQKNCKYRSGPELEIPGYSCQDHFLEPDTEEHCWQILAEIMERCPGDIVIDVGMPVSFHGVRYNCRVVFLNKVILLIRPKTVLANDRNYREERWFTPWHKRMVKFDLPKYIRKIKNQITCDFGVAVLKFQDGSKVGFEICEELWAPRSIGVEQSLIGADIIFNSSASHHQLRKFQRRVDLVVSGSAKSHSFYCFSNMHGCDGDRMCFDGGAMIARDGDLLHVGERFSLKDVCMTFARLDLDEIRASRSGIGSRQATAAASTITEIAEISVDFSLEADSKTNALYSSPCTLLYQPSGSQNDEWKPEEEIALGGPSLFLYDYLRRSGLSGFILPLSGGIDSAATACIVYGLATRLEDFQDVENENIKNLGIFNSKEKLTAKQICSKMLTTIYLPKSGNSSGFTEKCAAELADEIGAKHHKIPIDNIVESAIQSLPKDSEFINPGFSDDVNFKKWQEELAMQNVQARSRLLITYLAGATCDKGKGKIVLASSNADECLTGYLTKYDCSSGDINPIGAISKEDLKKVVRFMAEKFKLDSLKTISSAPPTAELKPLKDGEIEQTDEADMGLTYKELCEFGRLRSKNRCGPYSMFKTLVSRNEGESYTLVTAHKVITFFTRYAKNRHKMTVLTPSVHTDDYSPDDNRHDLRPFLMNSGWDFQYQKIKEEVLDMGFGEEVWVNIGTKKWVENHKI